MKATLSVDHIGFTKSLEKGLVPVLALKEKLTKIILRTNREPCHAQILDARIESLDFLN
jgi:hypothetical protein